MLSHEAVIFLRNIAITLYEEILSTKAKSFNSTKISFIKTFLHKNYTIDIYIPNSYLIQLSHR